MSSLSITYVEAFQTYRIMVEETLSNKGYTIVSDCPILRGEVQKIQAILGAKRELEIVEGLRANREDKFQRYVAWKPREEWAEEAEYALYQSWQGRLARAESSFTAMKAEYRVTEVSLF